MPGIEGSSCPLLINLTVPSSLLTNWRRQREQGALQDLRGRRRGPKPRPVDPRVKQLEAENRRLQRKLHRAETIITLPWRWCSRSVRCLLNEQQC
jgi:transposase-like protein